MASKIVLSELDGTVWVDLQPRDSRMIGIILSLPNNDYSAKMRMWNFPKSNLKHFVRKMLSMPDVAKEFWPVEGMEEEIKEALQEIQDVLDVPQDSEDLKIPPSLVHINLTDAEIYAPRKYQYRTAKWCKAARRTIMGLSMGLGKGMTSLSMFKMIREEIPDARALVVCKAGLKDPVWRVEIEKFSNFSHCVIDGHKTRRDMLYDSNTADITVISFEYIRLDWDKILELAEECAVCFVDEGTTFFVNARNKTYKLARTIFEQFKWLSVLTGTPLMNSMDELYDLTGLIDPTILGSKEFFKRRFYVYDDEGKVSKDQVRNVHQLRSMLSEVLIYKTAQDPDVMLELPEKVEQPLVVELSLKQKRAYNQIRREVMIELETIGSAANGTIRMQRVKNIMAKMTRMKQTCLAANELVDTLEGPKPIEDIKAGEKVISAVGIDTVVKSMRNEVTYAIRIRVGGKTITASPDHLFFTEEGWKKAEDLEAGSRLIRTAEALSWMQDSPNPESERTSWGIHEKEVLYLKMLLEIEIAHKRDSRKNFQDAEKARSIKDMRDMQETVYQEETPSSKSVQILQQEMCLNLGTKPTMVHRENKKQRSEERSRQGSKKSPVYSRKPHRDGRQRANRSSEVPARIPLEYRSQVDSGVYSNKWETRRNTTRYSPSRSQNMYRSRWMEPLHNKREDQRQDERRGTDFCRVESIEVLKPGDPRLEIYRNTDGRIYFYDLTIERHPSFSVSGFLVHNCDSLRLLEPDAYEPFNPKIEGIKDLLRTSLLGKKTIIFTQFKEMAYILEQELAQFNPVCLTGDIQAKGTARTDLVDKYQKDPTCQIFITTAAGGLGLNLTKTEAVILYDRLWNPKMHDQIIGRGIRMGNNAAFVTVITVMAQRTIEQKIDLVCAGKSRLFDQVIVGVENTPTEQPANDVEAMVKQLYELAGEEFDVEEDDEDENEDNAEIYSEEID